MGRKEESGGCVRGKGRVCEREGVEREGVEREGVEREVRGGGTHSA